MKKSVIIVLLSIFTFYGCNSDDIEREAQPLAGQRYSLTSIELEVSIDLNNDGVFSTNIISEENTGCLSMNRLSFGANSSSPIIEYIINVSIDENTNTYNENFGCGILDFFIGFEYVVEENNIYIFEENTEFDRNTAARGIIDGNQIFFNADLITFYFGLDTIINEQGEIVPYEGGISLVFTRDN
ncbi:hypothetical protein [Winogradskyella immobilis]|uniref:Uncharacterized protein n=1 Tax=Winogradskyella immobilis TaxID=2816852 RepID=A0ABS8EKJ6_9FLAO|nr:hypothetical protein [Winogradskyella immobilis]MCC1483546.1 hypothetical protein [Winogradskyella immobilis]MCG0015640.1 hypothetical protein [Winogradskyella immobilis]